jgi:O-antigen/teichoic acid export membrane protein
MDQIEPNNKEDPSKQKVGLKANFAYNFISQILTLIVPLVTTPYLSRVLHEAGNGQYSYALSIITIFIMLANLGFSTYGQREIAKLQDNEEERSKCFWEIVILRSISTIVVTSVFFAVLYTVGFKKCNDLILILSIKLGGSIFDIQFLFTGNEDFKSIAIRSIILKIIGLVCIFVFVKTENDTWIYTLCMAACTVFSNIVMWPSAFKTISFKNIKSFSYKRHIVPTLLIFVPTLAITIYSVLDKTMIGILVPADSSDYENGCYEQAYKINSVALLLVTLISPVMTSRNASDFKKGDIESLKHHIDYSQKYVWMMGSPLIAGFAALSPNLCTWFLGNGYAEVPLLLQIMSVRFIFSGFTETFGSQILIASGREKYVSIATVITALFDFVTNFWLIPLYGATGAAITTAVSELICFLFELIVVIKLRFVKIKGVLLNSWKYVLSSCVMFVFLYFVNMYMPSKLWSFIVMMVSGSLLYAILLISLRDNFFVGYIKKMLLKFKRK